MFKTDISRVVLGFLRIQDIPAAEITQILNTAFDAGINTLDEADIYGNYNSQKWLGRAFKTDKTLRKKFKIISKAGIVLKSKPNANPKIKSYNTTNKHIIESVNQTLTDLGTDYLDILLIHRPDQLIDPYEIDNTFQQLKKDGKVLNFGVSNFTTSQVNMMRACMNTPLVTNQIEFSALHPQPLFDGTLDQCIQKQIMPLAWSPLAGGRLFIDKDEQTVRVREMLTKIGDELGGFNVDAIALAWLLKHPSQVYPIIGTMKTERIKSAMEALKVKMSVEQWYRILEESQGHPVP